jgi:hypothetical protein
MNIRTLIERNAIVALVAVGGGYFGSVLHGWIGAAPDTIRAKRFEVVSTSGKTLSFWGPDSDPQIPAATPKGTLLVFMDPNGVRRVQFGTRTGDHGPELLFYDNEGPSEINPRQYLPEPRFSVELGYNDDPVLGMRDRSSWRVLLGAEHGDVPSVKEDDWRIEFRSRAGATSYMGTHGVTTDRSQAYVGVRDGQGKRWTMPPNFQFQIERVPVVPRHPRP